MKIIYNKIVYLLTFAFCMTLGSCDDFFDINKDPNSPSPQDADLAYLLPSAQGAFVISVADDINDVSSRLMRYNYDQFLSRYDISPNTMTVAWRDIYSNALPDINLYIQLAEEQELPGYSGIGKIIKAHIYSVAVDMYGEAPYHEGTQYTENLNPTLNSGLEVYKEVFALIDAGLADLQTEGAAQFVPSSDFFYAGNTEKWIRAANSLKMKLLIQTKNVDDTDIQNRIANELPAIISAGSYITETADDLQFRFGTLNNPESRHVWYVDDYPGDAGYKQLFFVNYLIENDDPRLHFYVVRQTATDPTGNAMPCFARECNNEYLGDGWIARDHGDSDGVPADGTARVAYGVYPAGGKYSPVGPFTAASEGQGLAGAGILPMITADYLKFLLAEAILTVPGVGGDAREVLEAGIRQNIAKVIAFGSTAPGYAAFAEHNPTAESIDGYVDGILANYDAAADDAARLDVVMFELWKAMYANPMESYNSYRRTGMPSILKTNAFSLDPVNQFILRGVYSSEEIASNSSITNIPNSRVPVFWDVNPENTNDPF